MKLSPQIQPTFNGREIKFYFLKGSVLTIRGCILKLPLLLLFYLKLKKYIYSFLSQCVFKTF